MSRCRQPPNSCMHSMSVNPRRACARGCLWSVLNIKENLWSFLWKQKSSRKDSRPFSAESAHGHGANLSCWEVCENMLKNWYRNKKTRLGNRKRWSNNLSLKVRNVVDFLIIPAPGVAGAEDVGWAWHDREVLNSADTGQSETRLDPSPIQIKWLVYSQNSHNTPYTYLWIEAFK